MNKATGIALAHARKARAIFVAGLAGLVLVACGGGAQTVDNPLPQNPGGPTIVTYNGANGPRDADVNAFLQSFWTPMQNSASCGNCHTENGTGPTPFARFDDINLAYDAAVTKVDMGVPSLSELVTKVSSGHNCWLNDDSACGDIMTTWLIPVTRKTTPTQPRRTSGTSCTRRISNSIAPAVTAPVRRRRSRRILQRLAMSIRILRLMKRPSRRWISMIRRPRASSSA